MAAFALRVITDTFNRYFFSWRNFSVGAPTVNTGEFYKACSRLCSCDSIEDLAETSSSVLKTLSSPTRTVLTFRHTRSGRYLNLASDLSHSSDLIQLTSTAKHFEFHHLDEKDELVTAGYFVSGERVLMIPVRPEGRTRHDLVIVAGHVKGRLQEDLLESLYEHMTACYTRLYRRSKIHSDKDVHAPLFKLCADLDEHSSVEIQVKVMRHLSEDMNCAKTCLLVADEETNHFVCQVVGEEVLDAELFFRLREDFFGHISRGKEPRIMEQLTTAEQEVLNDLFKTDVKSFLCVPILSISTKEVVALVCACNKHEEQRFSVTDVANVQECLRYTWTLITSSLALQKETKAKHECQAMLEIAKNLFTHLDDVTVLLEKVIQEARNLTKAERCSVFLVNQERNELVAKVFDGIVTAEEGMNEVRLPLSQGIAGQVATTGKTLNIHDAYSHPLFYRGIDEVTGFKTRNVLCFPIKDYNGDVVGVSQLCNKIKGPRFTRYDVELAERFAVFSGISISHSLLYKQVFEVQCRNQLANELMTYHMKVKQEEVENCLRSLPESSSHFHPDFSEFAYIPRELHDDHKVAASVQMFIDLGLVSHFRISTKTLMKFVLMVKQGYRDPPYHNWDHAFSVAHHAFVLAKNLDLNEVFGKLEVLALLTGSLCHDLDHRGTNNAFQISSDSILAALYSSQGSVLEHHHFAQAMSILNSGACNIFENMSKGDYVRALDLMKDIILATDLGRHLKILPKLEEMAEKRVNPVNCDKEQKTLLLHLCMTACDLSDQTKDWKNTKNTAHLIYKEFFSQGDMERSMGASPALIHDRERACVPEFQINFMQHIARPVYRILAAIFPVYADVYERFDDNVKRWLKVLEKFKVLKLPNTQALDFLTDEFVRDLFLDESQSEE